MNLDTERLITDLRNTQQVMQALTPRPPTEEDWRQHWRDQYAHIEPDYARWKAFMLKQRQGTRKTPTSACMMLAEALKESEFCIVLSFAAVVVTMLGLTLIFK